MPRLLNRQVKTGLVLLAALAAAYLVVAWAKNSGVFARNRTEYRVFFENVSGLQTSDPVTVYGHEAGHVARLERGQGGMVATLSVDETLRLRADARAEILLRELMGGKVVALYPGEAGEMLAPGDTLTGLPTFDFSLAVKQFGELFRQLDARQLASAFRRLDTLTARLADLTGPEQTEDLKVALRQLRQTAARANALLAEAQNRQTLRELDQTMGAVRQLGAQAETTLANADAFLAETRQEVLPDLREALRDAGALSRNADDLVERIDAALDSLEDSPTLANRLLYDAELSRQLDRSLAELDSTLTYMRNKAIRVKLKLGKIKP